MMHFDLAIGWLWEYDERFVLDLEAAAQRRGFTTFQIAEHNLDEVIERLRSRKLQFAAYIDRGFDVEDRFARIGKSVERRGGRVLNEYARTVEAIDKATMHLEFMTAGLHVPFTIIISPYTKRPDPGVTIEDLAHLGRPFIVKPANTTGGGIGVVMGAETLHDVLEARQDLQEDKYLIQEKINPRVLDGKRCWFRCFYACGKIFLAWWDDTTHIYELVTSDEERLYHLASLRKIMHTIARVSGLNFFSSEIALREATSFEVSQFVVVDYVNDMCDMRTTDIAADGLPNALYWGIVERLAQFADTSHTLNHDDHGA
jgi:hypothetical protein